MEAAEDGAHAAYPERGHDFLETHSEIEAGTARISSADDPSSPSSRRPANPRTVGASGGAEKNMYYLVMEYVRGETANALLTTQGAIAEGIVLSWARQLCDVLHYLHGQSPPIIFRDMKPGNIMITPQGQVKLIDFGIARHFRLEKAGDTQALGTPGYAAPEQYGRDQSMITRSREATGPRPAGPFLTAPSSPISTACWLEWS